MHQNMFMSLENLYGKSELIELHRKLSRKMENLFKMLFKFIFVISRRVPLGLIVSS